MNKESTTFYFLVVVIDYTDRNVNLKKEKDKEYRTRGGKQEFSFIYGEIKVPIEKVG